MADAFIPSTNTHQSGTVDMGLLMRACLTTSCAAWAAATSALVLFAPSSRMALRQPCVDAGLHI